MIIYRVTINIERSVEKEWLSWMKNEHIPELMQLKIFSKSKILKILNLYSISQTTFISYCIEYHCKSIEDYLKYKNEYAKKIQDKHSEKYQNNFSATRTILKLINES